MKKVWMAVSIGSLLAGCALAESMSGTISDANCGAKHAAATASDMACAKSCVKRGAAPVFVSGDKVYKIAADSREKVAALVERNFSRFHRQVRGGNIAFCDVPLANTHPLHDPLVAGVHHFFEILISQDPRRRVAAQSSDLRLVRLGFVQ